MDLLARTIQVETCSLQSLFLLHNPSKKKKTIVSTKFASKDKAKNHSELKSRKRPHQTTSYSHTIDHDLEDISVESSGSTNGSSLQEQMKKRDDGREIFPVETTEQSKVARKSLQDISRSIFNKRNLVNDFKTPKLTKTTSGASFYSNKDSVKFTPAKPCPMPVTIIDPFEHCHRESIQQSVLTKNESYQTFSTSLNCGRLSTSEARKSINQGFHTPTPIGTRNNLLDEVSRYHNFSKVKAPFKTTKKKLVGAAVLGRDSNVTMLLSLRRHVEDNAEVENSANQGILLLGSGKFGPGSFHVGRFLGGGVYGSVFQLNPCADNVRFKNVKSLAMKVEGGVRHLPWELHVLRKLHKTASCENVSPQTEAFRAAELLDLIVKPYDLVVYKDKCCMLIPQAIGNLDQVLLNSRCARQPWSQYVSAYYLTRILRAVELMFGAGIVHADLKLDNFVISLRDKVSHPNKSDKAAESSPHQQNAVFPEPVKLTVIDFGRSLDLDKYTGTFTRFSFDDRSLKSFGNSSKDFVPGAQWISKNGWVYDLDCHAIADFTLRFTQSRMTTESLLVNHQKASRDKGESIEKTLCSKLRFMRGWDQSLWSTFISDMLNPSKVLKGSTSRAKFIRLLRTYRQSFERVFEGHEKSLHQQLLAHIQLLKDTPIC